MKNLYKNHKGITLIALVITIIVLLILAGVTIASITSNDSAANKAVDARKENERGAARDAATLVVAEKTQEYYEGKYVGNNETARAAATAGAYANTILATTPVVKGEHTIKVEGGKLKVFKGADTDPLVTGTINSDGTITWDTTQINDNETQQQGEETNPTISTDVKLSFSAGGVDFSKLNQLSVSEYYGKTVTVIDGVEYGLLYVDYAGDFGEPGTIYLRSKTKYYDYINSYNPNISDNSLRIMKELNPILNNAILPNGEGYLDRYGATAQLFSDPNNELSSTIKTAFETKYGVDTVNYVIGGPSIELYLASYNSKYNTNHLLYYLNNSEYGESYPHCGLSYDSDSIEIDLALENMEGGVYGDAKDEEYFGGLCSPMYYGYLCYEAYDGLNHDSNDFARDCRPIVSLKPSVSFEKDVVLTKENVGKYYGKIVAKINDIEYGLYYVDFDEDFGDKNTIYIKALSDIGKSKCDTELTDENEIADAMTIAKSINKDWANAIGNKEYTDLIKNEKGTVYLCNPKNSLWAGEDNEVVEEFETKYGTGNVNYVIGAPSIEIFVKSINQACDFSGENAIDARWFPNKISGDTTTSKYKYSGYLFSNTGRDTTSNSQYDSLLEFSEEDFSKEIRNFYFESDAASFIASPASNTSNLKMTAVRYGDINSYNGYSTSAYIFPMVSLKPGVQIEI